MACCQLFDDVSFVQEYCIGSSWLDFFLQQIRIGFGWLQDFLLQIGLTLNFQARVACDFGSWGWGLGIPYFPKEKLSNSIKINNYVLQYEYIYLFTFYFIKYNIRNMIVNYFSIVALKCGIDFLQGFLIMGLGF